MKLVGSAENKINKDKKRENVLHIEVVEIVKLDGPLMKVAMPLAKNVLAPLGLTAAMSAIDGSI